MLAAVKVYEPEVQRFISSSLREQWGDNWFERLADQQIEALQETIKLAAEQGRSTGDLQGPLGKWRSRKVSVSRGRDPSKLLEAVDFPFIVDANRDLFWADKGPRFVDQQRIKMENVYRARNSASHQDDRPFNDMSAQRGIREASLVLKAIGSGEAEQLDNAANDRDPIASVEASPVEQAEPGDRLELERAEIERIGSNWTELRRWFGHDSGRRTRHPDAWRRSPDASAERERQQQQERRLERERAAIERINSDWTELRRWFDQDSGRRTRHPEARRLLNAETERERQQQQERRLERERAAIERINSDWTELRRWFDQDSGRRTRHPEARRLLNAETERERRQQQQRRLEEEHAEIERIGSNWTELRRWFGHDSGRRTRHPDAWRRRVNAEKKLERQQQQERRLEDERAEIVQIGSSKTELRRWFDQDSGRRTRHPDAWRGSPDAEAERERQQQHERRLEEERAEIERIDSDWTELRRWFGQDGGRRNRHREPWERLLSAERDQQERAEIERIGSNWPELRRWFGQDNGRRDRHAEAWRRLPDGEADRERQQQEQRGLEEERAEIERIGSNWPELRLWFGQDGGRRARHPEARRLLNAETERERQQQQERRLERERAEIERIGSDWAELRRWFDQDQERREEHPEAWGRLEQERRQDPRRRTRFAVGALIVVAIVVAGIVMLIAPDDGGNADSLIARPANRVDEAQAGTSGTSATSGSEGGSEGPVRTTEPSTTGTSTTVKPPSQDPQPVGSPVDSLVVSAGASHSCMLMMDESVECWGSNKFGQTNAPSGSFSFVSAGGAHTCGIRTGGTVVCWGWNEYGQTNAPPVSFRSVSAGLRHTCGIRTGGTVVCWGWNEYGQRDAPSVGSFTSINAGFYHTCGIRTGGTVVCWGWNEYGQANAPPGSFESVSGGFRHSCGVRSISDSAYCWGSNEFGQSNPPPGGFTLVSAGQDHSCGLRATGTVMCWGSNEYGQSMSSSGFASVSAGARHTCGLRTSGEFACWGSNGEGQLER